MQTLRVDIVSDIACPWCAIGFARLEKALQQLAGELAVEVRWHAFELNPDPSAPRLPILEALSRKYGRSPAEMEAAQRNMMDIASGLGLDFSRMQERFTANTFDAHRLVKWAAEQDRATEMKMACFDAYFGRAADVSDPDVLLGCAQAAGLDRQAAQAVLESDAFADQVRADEAQYQQAGISAVPAFILNQRYLISGAQEPDTLVEALRQVAAEAS
jgi:predicted DsbA family dithiol-disulfide isomerase